MVVHVLGNGTLAVCCTACFARCYVAPTCAVPQPVERQKHNLPYLPLHQITAAAAVSAVRIFQHHPTVLNHQK